MASKTTLGSVKHLPPISAALNSAIADALGKPSGARFYRCALQVNPFQYVRRHKKSQGSSDERSYNDAIVSAAVAAGVEVIAVTDHYRVRTGEDLRARFREAGVIVLQGFEASTKDGAHLLCLFDSDKNIDVLERVLGDCGIYDESVDSPTGQYDVGELLSRARGWGAVVIAAHVTAPTGGLLAVLKGGARINAWRSPELLACSIPGTVKEVPNDLRPILENANPDYWREQPVAVINAQDVSDPSDFGKTGTTTYIKMSEVSTEGLRQAFLDPGSRIRLNSDPLPEGHTEFLAMSWQGGFLDGVGLHWNENLNVLIGGRGTGKSTVVESLRYVLGLEPLGDEAKKAHEGIVRHVIKNGTKISLAVRSHRPARRDYLIERTVPNPPVVRSDLGEVLNVAPLDVVGPAEVYGQHEISELTKSPEKRTRLLERFADHEPTVGRRKTELRRELERSRAQILDAQKDIRQIDDRLASLPALEETLKRFQEAGMESRLRDQSLLVREERVVGSFPERLSSFSGLLDGLRRELPIDRAFLSQKALDDLPGRPILERADEVFEVLSHDLEAMAVEFEAALTKAAAALSVIREQWNARKQQVQAEYETILRDLQKSKVDGETFITLRRQIEELRPLRDRQESIHRSLREQQERRRNLLAEWEDVKASEFRELEGAASRVNKQLASRVRVTTTFLGNREPLAQLLRERIQGRFGEAVEILRQRDALSLTELVDVARAGRDALVAKFGFTPGQADRLAQSSADVFMQIEELELPATTTVELNVADGGGPAWRRLEELSTGQKATAVLLLLLLESNAPLIVDQPEDDLDNRFIADGIVPRMRSEKRRRQFLFATHNANIPVLGDAEQIMGLTALGEAGGGQADVAVEHMGSIDARAVRLMVEEILEGGKEAFEMRRRKYGF